MREPDGSLAAILCAANQPKITTINKQEIDRRNAHVAKQLTEKNLVAIDISADGNCCCHALSVCLYGHESKHVELLHQVAQHMVNNINFIFADICS